MSRPPKYAAELLVAFGELRADVKNLVKNSDAANEKLDELSTRVGKLEPVVKVVNEEIKPAVDRFKKYEQRGLAVWFVLTVCGSTFGGVLLKKVFGLEIG